MAIQRIPRSSGKFSIFLINKLLHSSIAPDLAVEPDKIEHSRKTMDLWGKFMPVAGGVHVKNQSMGGVECQVHGFKNKNKPLADGVILYLHGGGYCVGSPLSHRHVVARLVREAGMQAVVPNYRKAPENPFPAAIEDALSVYRALLEQGVSSKRIYLCGDSAGGNLVLSTLLQLKQSNIELPAAACCISPWTDMSMSGASIRHQAENDLLLNESLLHQFADHYAPSGADATARQNPQISPLFADLSGLPPLLIQVGSHEVLLDDSLRLEQNAAKAGVDVQLQVWEEMQHVWHYSFTLLKDGRDAIASIARFFDGRQ